MHFQDFSIAWSLGASRDYSARRNGSILNMECAGSTRSAGLVEYGTVLAYHNSSTYERSMLNIVKFWIEYLAQRLSEARSWCGVLINCKKQHTRTFWQNSKNRRSLKKKRLPHFNTHEMVTGTSSIRNSNGAESSVHLKRWPIPMHPGANVNIHYT